MMVNKPTIWLTRRLSDNTRARALRDYEAILNHDDHACTDAEIIDMSHAADGILCCHSERFCAALVDKLGERLKIIANHSVGVDHCDLQALAARGIVVTNTPDVLCDATAEIAVLLMLGAARRAVEGDQMVRAGEWSSWSPSFMVGKQVTGKRLGILGLGKVGRVVAERARGFAMRIHYHNRTRLPKPLEGGATYHDSLESLFSVSDFLSLHCPSNEDSQNIINRETLAWLPHGAILINTARGALVDEDALVEAIDSGKLSAAGIDCFKSEPGGNPQFSRYPNIFMLPHIGSANAATRDAMGFRALDNLDRFFAGQEPQDRVA